MNLILSIIKIKQYEWLRLNPSKKSKSMSKKEIEQKNLLIEEATNKIEEVLINIDNDA